MTSESLGKEAPEPAIVPGVDTNEQHEGADIPPTDATSNLLGEVKDTGGPPPVEFTEAEVVETLKDTIKRGAGGSRRGKKAYRLPGK